MATGGRLDRVQRLAKQVLGEAIHDLKDPRIGFATVTSVRVTPDLQHARVMVSVLGSPEEQEDTMKGLESAKKHLRSELNRQVRMRYSPDLSFHLDHGPEEAERLETILRKIHEESREEGS